jgi:hypothetical protein
LSPAILRILFSKPCYRFGKLPQAHPMVFHQARHHHKFWPEALFWLSADFIIITTIPFKTGLSFMGF